MIGNREEASDMDIRERFRSSIRTPAGIRYTIVFALLAVVLLANYSLFSLKANAGTKMRFVWFGLFFLILAFLIFTYIRQMRMEFPGPKCCISVPGLIGATAFFALEWHFGVEIIVNPKWRKISLTHHLLGFAGENLEDGAAAAVVRPTGEIPLDGAENGGSDRHCLLSCVCHRAVLYDGVPRHPHPLL